MGLWVYEIDPCPGPVWGDRGRSASAGGGGLRGAWPLGCSGWAATDRDDRLGQQRARSRC
jgi:hypothetical protein